MDLYLRVLRCKEDMDWINSNKGDLLLESPFDNMLFNITRDECVGFYSFNGEVCEIEISSVSFRSTDNVKEFCRGWRYSLVKKVEKLEKEIYESESVINDMNRLGIF